MHSVSGGSGSKESNNQSSNKGGRSQVNLKAVQVIVRQGDPDPDKTLPLGSNFIGKLLNTIDTRDPDLTVKVSLPYGARGKAQGNIPPNSILMGKATYPGKGEKIFIQFNKGVDHDGREFDIDAQALSSKDYSTGVVGDFHGTTDVRVATTLGLTMVGGVTDVLTEKEAVGNSLLDSVNPKPTMKNALLHGVSQVAQSESQRQAEKLNENQDYVTVPEGSDVIVSLTKAFIEK